MSTDLSLLGLVLNASVLVQLVMLVLLAASVVSWTMIFRKHLALKRARHLAEEFEERFWSCKDIVTMYNQINSLKADTVGLERIFQAGFREFARLRGQGGID